MNTVIRKLLFTLCSVACTASLRAEDIDLFLGAPPVEAGVPNVLFIIDNTSNWRQPFDDEMDALVDVFEALPVGSVNVGIMLNSKVNSVVRNVKGGYVRAAIRLIDEDAKDDYRLMLLGNQDDGGSIRGFQSNVHDGAGGQASVVMAEAWQYFSGGEPFAGNHEEADYRGNTYMYNGGNAVKCCAESHDVWGRPGNALDSLRASAYNSPVDPNDSCAGNYIIYIGNGPNQSSASSERNADQLLLAADWPYSATGGISGSGVIGSGGGGAQWVDLAPEVTVVDGPGQYLADEWAAFMRHSRYGISTYTIDINATTSGQGPAWSDTMRNMAHHGGGEYVDIDGDYDNIVKAVTDILSAIIAQNSVFASVALPASANAQSTFLNQVYIGQFRPDEGRGPRWFGNLKQYKLGLDADDVLRLLDANDVPALYSSSTGDTEGLFKECVSSFWTPALEDDYWDFLDPEDQRGSCISAADPGSSNTPDGPHVEKGGQAYVLRSDVLTPTSPALRKVFTCTPASGSSGCSGLTDFNVLNSDVQFPGITDANERIDRIRWARGYDVQDENGVNGQLDFRPSVHGDVIHSQPVAVDFARGTGTPEVVVFYGANDGSLRAINGSRTDTLSGIDAGGEFWAFIPPEFYDDINHVFDPNSVTIRFPATAATAPAAGVAKSYGPDGPITAWLDPNSPAVNLYVGMRRGGRTLYAFDVSDTTSNPPTDPVLKWRKGCPNLDNDTDCTTGWANIGQTWSQASVTPRAGGGPVILMGGGYDACEDYDNDVDQNNNCAGSDKGNSIYVLDADTGAILKEFGTDRAVPGRVTVVPLSEGDRDIAFAYAADTGGNLYRISGVNAESEIGSSAPVDWTITKIASFGCGGTATATCSAARKFLFGPDVVRVPDRNYEYQLLLGSGDREKPLYDYGGAAAVQNYFVSFVDKPKVPAWLIDPSPSVCGADEMCLDRLSGVSPSGPLDPNAPVNPEGWKYQLAAGEQVVSGALTVADVVNFSTHVPQLYTPGDCDAGLGTASTYNLKYSSGEGEQNVIVGGGLVPTPVAGNVILDDGTVVPFCISCGGEASPIGAAEASAAASWLQAKNRIYWKILK
ncbi:pilus assembly protein PilY [Mangrovimicrobium sediminis]|uniref:Pilus assembly protein PilY n=1 Tax=Mangrovimicrobium sediminis TaxID=2562682 RepID=A0A4Z0LWN5_9GAMM|nr:PilC/PilY family type IV pilus protein [Haliea sp. SAOS-164]TGD71577.1 pilus assembly protein PilY [Haliea sp. SAOS-164]